MMLLAVFCITVLNGCSETPTSPNQSTLASEYYPLQIGNTWKYQILIRNTIVDSFDVSINSTQIFNGKTYFVVGKSSRNGKYAPSYCRTENDKVYHYSDGKEFATIDFATKDTTIGYVYETVDAVVSAVGTFNKVKNVTWIASAWDAEPYKNSYVPNVGLIYSGSFGGETTLIYAKVGDKIYK